MPASDDRTPIYGIDAARFFAATIVVLYHFSAKPFLTPAASTLRPLLTEPRQAPAGAVWWGWIGVQIFFVISGVVISYSAAGATPRSFFVGRSARLWPAMLICATLAALLNVLFWKHSIGREIDLLARSLLFWPTGPWVSGQIWTLPIEICFYSLVWLLILCRRPDRLDLLAWAIGSISAVFWLLERNGLVETRGLYALLLFQHGIYFALGIALMALGTGRRTPGWALLSTICIGTAWLEIATTTFHEQPTRTALAVVPYAIWLAACSLILASIAYRRAIAGYLECGPGLAAFLRRLGSMTYPLYLIHVQPGGLLLAAALSLGASIWIAVLGGYLAAITLAAITAVWLEPPLHQAVKRGLTWLAEGFSCPVKTKRRVSDVFDDHGQ